MSKTYLKTPLNLTLKENSSRNSPILTPGSTPSDTPVRSDSRGRTASLSQPSTMEGESSEKSVDHEGKDPEQQSTTVAEIKPKEVKQITITKLVSKPGKAKQAKKATKAAKFKKTKKKSKHESSSESSDSDSSNSDDDDEDSPSSSDSSSSEDEKEKRKKARKRKALKKKQKKKNSKRREHSNSDSDSNDSEASDSGSDSSSVDGRRVKRGKAKRRTPKYVSEHEDDENYDESTDVELMKYYDLQAQAQAQLVLQLRRRTTTQNRGGNPGEKQRLDRADREDREESKSKEKKKSAKRASTLEYKRVDQLWDSAIHDFKLTESAKRKEDIFEQYVFTVRRKFDWENKYRYTVVDIKSVLLKEALQEVMKDVKSVSLVEEQPSLDPNMLFMYLEEFREYAKKTLKSKIKSEKKQKLKKRLNMTKAHLKVLINYLDKDYEQTKKTLNPMLEAGNITFDLLWALFKPNSIAYTDTYAASDHPRCFKVDYATKEQNFMRGEWYCIEGQYLEYDGKSFGLGNFEVDVDAFKGPRKITSLKTYPLAYHKDCEGLTKRLIARGKEFVAMEGMNYRFHSGLAFMKKKKTVAKVNIHGRIMIDPAIFRRMNPNYPITFIKPREFDDCSCCGSDGEDEGEDDCKSEKSADGGQGLRLDGSEKEDKEHIETKVVLDSDGKPYVVEVLVDEDGQVIPVESIDKLPENTDSGRKRTFTDEELLIASPVVLGFAFNEKLWLEFSLSGVKDIEWNEGAFESLVIPASQKTIVKALVESHKFHAAKTIDDVVQGKGKGLVAVLHGTPGTGKTLTAEGIAELLKCPLYMVSAGELGTDPHNLEYELQKILDIAHSWGAVLLLDEADVFLEKRQIHDIHRNALVSIFLRLLEYFQGILFLTTNRVETFDDAFQSRIHVALRYGELTGKAKKAVWKMFLEKVRVMEGGGVDSETFKDAELETLARNNLNGRQIKNAVRTAQALAVNEKQKLSMEHIKRVLDVAESFEQDLKGGSGYQDAMRSYT